MTPDATKPTTHMQPLNHSNNNNKRPVVVRAPVAGRGLVGSSTSTSSLSIEVVENHLEKIIKPNDETAPVPFQKHGSPAVRNGPDKKQQSVVDPESQNPYDRWAL